MLLHYVALHISEDINRVQNLSWKVSVGLLDRHKTENYLLSPSSSQIGRCWLQNAAVIDNLRSFARTHNAHFRCEVNSAYVGLPKMALLVIPSFDLLRFRGDIRH